MQMGSGFTLGD